MTSKVHPGKTEWAGKKHIQTCPSFAQHSSMDPYCPQEKIPISLHVCQALHEVVSAHLSHASSPFSTQFLFSGVCTSLRSFMPLEWDISHSLRPHLHQEAPAVRVTAHISTPGRCWAVKVEQLGEQRAVGKWEGVGGRRAEVSGWWPSQKALLILVRLLQRMSLEPGAGFWSDWGFFSFLGSSWLGQKQEDPTSSITINPHLACAPRTHAWTALNKHEPLCHLFIF